MSYFGSKFPEGVSPEYVEIGGPKNITCPKFRRVAIKALSANDTTYFDCEGCGTKDSLIIVIDQETERIFVKPDSNCVTPNMLDLPKERPPPDSD